MYKFNILRLIFSIKIAVFRFLSNYELQITFIVPAAILALNEILYRSSTTPALYDFPDTSTWTVLKAPICTSLPAYYIASGLHLCFHLCIFTEAQHRLVEIFTQLFFKTIYCIIFGTLCLTTKRKLHL